MSTRLFVGNSKSVTSLVVAGAFAGCLFPEYGEMQRSEHPALGETAGAAGTAGIAGNAGVGGLGVGGSRDATTTGSEPVVPSSGGSLAAGGTGSGVGGGSDQQAASRVGGALDYGGATGALGTGGAPETGGTATFGGATSNGGGASSTVANNAGNAGAPIAGAAGAAFCGDNAGAAGVRNCSRPESETCNSDCTIAVCGDGKTNRTALEECEVLNGTDSSTCNGVTAKDSAGKSLACKASYCGDGYTNRKSGEECDAGAAGNTDCFGADVSAICQCHMSKCGDGIVDRRAGGRGETCDPGPVSVEGCAQCQVDPHYSCQDSQAGVGYSVCAPICGDGYAAPGREACDDGNRLQCGTCNESCTQQQPLAIAEWEITMAVDYGYHPGDHIAFMSGRLELARCIFGVDIATPTYGPSEEIARRIKACIDDLSGKLDVSVSFTGGELDPEKKRPTVHIRNLHPGATWLSEIVTANSDDSEIGAPHIAVVSKSSGYDCTFGTGCVRSEDCLSRICSNGFCQARTCEDGIQNGTETDVDCGGTCALCRDGMSCAASGDCKSRNCRGNTCEPPSCADAIQNGTETDVDCGGSDCVACSDRRHCYRNADCLSNMCTRDICSQLE